MGKEKVGIGTYTVADDELSAGSTLGGPKLCMVLKPTSAIGQIFSVDWGQNAFGALTVHHWDVESGLRLAPRPGTTILHPERQEHWFALSNDVTVHEDAFVLSSAPRGGEVDPPAAYYMVRLRNDSHAPVRIATVAFCQVAGTTTDDATRDVRVRHDPELGAVLAWEGSRPERVRVFGCSATPRGCSALLDHAFAVNQAYPGDLDGPDEARADQPLSAFQLVHALGPGKEVSFSFLLTFSDEGLAGAGRTYRSCPTAEEALARTAAYFAKVLARAQVWVPNPQINEGVLWAKVNMLRAELKTPTGWSFTNDPARSSNVVARDTAWFGFGADYLTPEFVREALLGFVQRQDERGMIVEYYNALDGETEDLGFNINDDTPLLILGLWHHYAAAGDRAFLEEIYPSAVKAARYILSQRNEQGLVWCTATGTGGHGIIGWRNVISGYRLSGATTEVNAECYAALHRVAEMARVLGKGGEADRFETEAEALKEAINTHLRNPDNGLYYLNIDVDGRPRGDVTSDLVFPVIFGVAPDEVAARIVKRLMSDDFWTEAGIRVVPRDAPSYSPDHGYGLLGGVWVGVSFWFAFAAARFEPRFMDHALAASYRTYSRNPRQNNTVPGQFSEWLHGETLTNEGMMLSPWFPPRYLWAAIEGAAGLDLSPGTPRLTPRLAPQWKWLCVRDLQLRGRSATWLVVRTPEPVIYATYPFEAPHHVELHEEDLTSQVGVDPVGTVGLGLRREGQVLLFVGNTRDTTIAAAVRCRAPLAGSYRLRSYDSLEAQWREGGQVTAEHIAGGLTLQVERQGFCLLELTQEG